MSTWPNSSSAVFVKLVRNAGLRQIAGVDRGLAVDLVRGLLGDLAVDVVDEHPRPLAREQLRRGSPDAARDPVMIAALPSAFPSFESPLVVTLAYAAGTLCATQLPMSWRPRISFMISSVPPPIGPRRASRSARSIPYSRMYP